MRSHLSFYIRARVSTALSGSLMNIICFFSNIIKFGLFSELILDMIKLMFLLLWLSVIPWSKTESNEKLCVTTIWEWKQNELQSYKYIRTPVFTSCQQSSWMFYLCVCDSVLYREVCHFFLSPADLISILLSFTLFSVLKLYFWF